MIINLNNKKYDEKKTSKLIKFGFWGMYLFTFIALLNLINLGEYNNGRILKMISGQMTQVIPVLAVISCWMYYYTYKKDKLFLIMLIFLSIASEHIFINIIIENSVKWEIISSSFLVIPYLFRTIYITLMAMQSNSVSKWIMKNKKAFIIITIPFTLLFTCVNLYLYYVIPLENIWLGVNLINAALIIYHFLIIAIMAYKSINQNEVIYTIIMLSMNFFIIKRVYSLLYVARGSDRSITEWCNSLLFMGYSIIILGIFLELTLTLNESNRLHSELKIFYSQAEENYNNFICIYNEKSEVVYANKITRVYYGVEESKSGYHILNSKISRNVSDDQKEAITHKLYNKSAWKGNVFLNDGSVIESNMQTIDVGNEQLYRVVTSRDITDDYKISHELKINEKRLRLITENIEDLIFTIDINGFITYVNSAVLKVLKCEMDEIVGEGYIDIIGDGDKTSLDIAITENNTNVTLEHEIINRYNESFIVESVISTINDFYEEPIGKVIVSRDLQQRKEIEALKSKYEEVRQYDQIKNEFFANLSHELRTPINILYSCMQLMDVKRFDEEEQFLQYYDKYEKTMKQNCFRMLRLVNNLIDITKIDSGFIKVDFCNYDIINLVENITMSVIPYVEAKKINIVFDTEIEELEIRCDPDKIERVMLNLLSNSVKFTEKEGTIQVNINVSNEWVQIRVKDDGVGIPIHMREFVFERFIQTDKSFNRAKEGSGIGLALVKSLVELHGGKVYLNNEITVGSEFIVLLPNIKETEVDCKCRELDYKPTVDRISIEFADIYDIN